MSCLHCLQESRHRGNLHLTLSMTAPRFRHSRTLSEYDASMHEAHVKPEQTHGLHELHTVQTKAPRHCFEAQAVSTQGQRIVRRNVQAPNPVTWPGMSQLVSVHLVLKTDDRDSCSGVCILPRHSCRPASCSQMHLLLLSGKDS